MGIKSPAKVPNFPELIGPFQPLRPSLSRGKISWPAPAFRGGVAWEGSEPVG